MLASFDSVSVFNAIVSWARNIALILIIFNWFTDNQGTCEHTLKFASSLCQIEVTCKFNVTFMTLPSSNLGKNCPEFSRSITWSSVPRELGCTMVRASTIKLLTVKEILKYNLDQGYSEHTEVIFFRYVKKEKQRKYASAIFWYATLDHMIWADGISFQVLDNGPTRFNKYSACYQRTFLPALKMNCSRA